MDKLICYIEAYKPIIDMLTASIPIILTIFGICIAIQQWRVNRNRLKNDLFDRRYAVFIATNKFLGAIMRSVVTTKEQQADFLSSTRGAKFIFDSKVKKYIDEIWDKSIDLEEWAGDELSFTHATERANHLKWVSEQFKKIDIKFKKYLQLKH